MSFSTELEKQSASTIDALKTIMAGLYSSTKSGIQFVGKHPKTTMGVVGGGLLGALGLNTVMNVGDRVHHTYDILENERKRKIMDKQVELLSGILAENKKLNPPVQPKVPPRFIPVTPKLI